MLVLARSTREVLTADKLWWMLRSFAFLLLFARYHVPVCYEAVRPPQNKTKRRMKTWNMIKRSREQEIRQQQPNGQGEEPEEKKRRDPYFCPCDPDHVCQLSITFAWRVIHCWMELFYSFPCIFWLFLFSLSFAICECLSSSSFFT